jgi:hypothetical protein
MSRRALARAGARTPGVPQISVRALSLSSSMTLERPKSATMISASSSGVRKRRFSGFRSGDVTNELHISTRCLGKRTTVNDATCVDVLDGLGNGADEAGGVPKDRMSVRSGTI